MDSIPKAETIDRINPEIAGEFTGAVMARLAGQCGS
jgi:hypothetical protein